MGEERRPQELGEEGRTLPQSLQREHLPAAPCFQTSGLSSCKTYPAGGCLSQQPQESCTEPRLDPVLPLSYLARVRPQPSQWSTRPGPSSALGLTSPSYPHYLPSTTRPLPCFSDLQVALPPLWALFLRWECLSPDFPSAPVVFALIHLLGKASPDLPQYLSCICFIPVPSPGLFSCKNPSLLKTS